MVISGAAKNSGTFTVTTPSDHEIRMTRLFDAPRQLVFEVMSAPEHVRRWWGQLGEGYSVPVCEIDLRPGGRWRFVNRHPRGDAAFHGEYRRSRLPAESYLPRFSRSFRHRVRGDGGTRRRRRQDASDRHGAVLPSKDVRDMVIASGMARGAGISYDRLEDLLAELQRA